MNLCQCGCGNKVNIGKRFILGHAMSGRYHSEESKRKMAEAKIGDKNPAKRPDVRKKLRKAQRKRVASDSYVNGFQDKHHSEESKREMGESLEGRIVWNEGLPRTDKEKQNISKGRSGILDSNEGRENKRIAAKKRWQNPEYREKQLKAIFRGSSRKPTKPEKRLRRILNKLFSNEYKYVGNGQVIIGFKNPDFINVNGQKKIIELFGDYWHSKECTGMSKQKHERLHIKHFANYGFDTLIVWECELQNESDLIQKVREFTNPCLIGE